jgi:integrase
MHAYIAVSLTTGLRAEEIRELRCDHVVAWTDGQRLAVTTAGFEHEQFAVLVWPTLRQDGETRTELSRRSLELPQVAVQALKKWQLAQADERIAGIIVACLIPLSPALHFLCLATCEQRLSARRPTPAATTCSPGHGRRPAARRHARAT